MSEWVTYVATPAALELMAPRQRAEMAEIEAVQYVPGEPLPADVARFVRTIPGRKQIILLRAGGSTFIDPGGYIRRWGSDFLSARIDEKYFTKKPV